MNKKHIFSILLVASMVFGVSGTGSGKNLKDNQGEMYAQTSKRIVKAPEPPELISPPDRMSLTDIAEFFMWKNVEDAAYYELELSREDGWRGIVQINRMKPSVKHWVMWRNPKMPINKMKAGCTVWMPKNPIGPGKWFWRVRAISKTGLPSEWSKMRMIEVNTDHSKQEPIRIVSPQKPLFMIHTRVEGGDRIVKNWQSIPDDLKPYCALRVSSVEEFYPGFTLLDLCKIIEKHGIPVVIQCSQAFGGVYTGLDEYGHYTRVSLSDLEYAFQRCSMLIGAMVAEQQSYCWRGSSSEEYIKRLIRLCGKYGRNFIWSDGHRRRYLWLDVGANESLCKLFKSYREIFIPVAKFNYPVAPLMTHGCVLGLWHSGYSRNFGVAAESWYWYEAGFGKENEFPPIFWGSQLLVGLASGATVYGIEPSRWIWNPPGKLTSTWNRIIGPLLRDIINYSLIPSKEEIEKKTRIACLATMRDLESYKGFGTFTTMYEGTYGIRHSSELIPDTSRYFFIPILPVSVNTNSLSPSLKIVQTNTCTTSKGWQFFFNQYYPLEAKGEAFASLIGNTIVIMHTRENEDVEESYRLPIEAGPIKAICGKVGMHQYIVGKQQKDTLYLQVNNYPERESIIAFETVQSPEITVKPVDALVESDWEWEAQTKRLVVKLSHQHGAVCVTLSESK